MPMFGASINMVSMFAFILVLGIVVDDAIVVGENIFRRRQEGTELHGRAAVEGARDVATPVFFAVATTVATFGPLLFVPGFIGKIFGVIPIIVIATLAISWIESVFVLPAHLGHGNKQASGVLGWVISQQLKVSRSLERFIENIYAPVAKLATRHRYTTLSIALATVILLGAAVKGGAFRFAFLPKLESDNVTATIQLPLGTPLDQTKTYQKLLLEKLTPVLRSFERDGKPVDLGVLAVAGGTAGGGGGPRGGTSGGASSNIASVRVTLAPYDERSWFSSGDFARKWRESVGEVVGAEKVSFGYTFGGGGGEAINIRLSHPDIVTLESTAQRVAEQLQNIDGVTDIDPGFAKGKAQINARLSDAGRALGFTERDLANRMRSAFYGIEALRQQRGRDEVRVIVRRPRSDRTNPELLQTMIIPAPNGTEVTLGRIANFNEDRAYSSIYRVDGARAISVTAELDEKKANANEILRDLQGDFLASLTAQTPGLTYSLEGERRSQRESMSALGKNFIFALLLIFCLLAIPFKSYGQPFLVMSAIPFGAVGAVLGHWVMGFELSIMSMMGIVALSGVVVNDSLILIIATNKFRRGGANALDAAVEGAKLRFRPILLTSLTTSFGLTPMILETSVQARFLIPMAISLGFGILWATVVILLAVPALYVIYDDFLRGSIGYILACNRLMMWWMKATERTRRPPRKTLQLHQKAVHNHLNSTSSYGALKSMQSQLKDAFPHLRIETDASERQRLGQDWTRFYQPNPLAIVFPKTIDDVQRLVRFAIQNHLSIVPSGGRTGLSGGAVATNGEIVLAMDAMNAILSFDSVDRIVNVQAGVLTETIQTYAEQHGLFYPVDFASAGSSQIGGNIATNAGGINVIRYGMTREWVVGLKVVTGTGEILELNHGLTKNNTGYDLRHLLIGSEGTLGIICEASLRLTTRPKTSAVLVLGIPELNALMKVLARFQETLTLSAFEFSLNSHFPKSSNTTVSNAHFRK